MKNSNIKIKGFSLLMLIIFMLSCSKLSLSPQVPANPTLEETPTSLASPLAEDVLAFTAFSDGWKERYIYVAKISSTNEIEISKYPQDMPIDWPIDLSPDKKRIALSAEDMGIFIMGIDGLDVSQLTDYGRSPQWSSDGKWILFENKSQDISGEYVYEVNAINLDTLEIYGCSGFNDNTSIHVRWIPNSLNLIYSTGDIYSSDIYQCDVVNKTAKPVVLTESITELDPYPSPNGHMVIYNEFNFGQGILQTFKLAELSPEGIISSNPFLETVYDSDGSQFSSGCCVSWSPDSQFFSILLGSDPSLPSDIYVFDVNGNLNKRITSTPEWGEGAPIWLDSGRFIAFTRTPFGLGNVLHQVVAVDVESGEEIVLVSEPETEFYFE